MNYPINYDKTDAIIIDSEKIIISFCYNNYVYLKIIQFHNNYSLLSIRSFNSINMVNYILSNIRLSTFKSSFILCFGVQNINKVGFFFIGYPNTIDINITDNNNIKVSDILSIENNIFSFGLHIIILSIPDDFIFTNYFIEESIKIKPGTYLDIYDQLVFKQY